MIDRARKFVDGFVGRYRFVGPDRFENIAKCATDFATREVEAERRRIADELEVILGGSLNYRVADAERFIDRLRGETNGK